MYVNTLGLFTLPKLFICLGQMSIIVAMTNIVTYFLSYCLNFKLRPQHQSPSLSMGLAHVAVDEKSLQ